MKPAPESLTRELLARHGSRVTLRLLHDRGYKAHPWVLQKAREELVKAGIATPGSNATNAMVLGDPALSAEYASRELLRRHLITGKHWITDPARFAAACNEAGLAA